MIDFFFAPDSRVGDALEISDFATLFNHKILLCQKILLAVRKPTRGAIPTKGKGAAGIIQSGNRL
jgi:hypothetical protein